MQLISHIKQRIFGFFLFFIYAFTGYVIVFLVQFHTDEMSVFLDGCDSGRATSDAVVEYQIALVGLCSCEVSE